MEERSKLEPPFFRYASGGLVLDPEGALKAFLFRSEAPYDLQCSWSPVFLISLRIWVSDYYWGVRVLLGF